MRRHNSSAREGFSLDVQANALNGHGIEKRNRFNPVKHGKSIPRRFTGQAKGKQRSYPYEYEHDGELFVAYSIGKDDCVRSVISAAALKPLTDR